MNTTPDTIREWLKQGQEQHATHMLVVCDTYDWEDYPVYVSPEEDVQKVIEANNGPNMTKLMECYNLSIDIQMQLNEFRAFHV
jgi:hypothetical protein